MRYHPSMDSGLTLAEKDAQFHGAYVGLSSPCLQSGLFDYCHSLAAIVSNSFLGRGIAFHYPHTKPTAIGRPVHMGFAWRPVRTSL